MLPSGVKQLELVVVDELGGAQVYLDYSLLGGCFKAKHKSFIFIYVVECSKVIIS